MIEHLDKALAQGMDYESYRSKVESLFNEGKTTNDDNRDSMLHYTKLNMQRMNKWDKIAKLTEASIDQMQSIANPETWIVLTEGWCGDAAHNLPFIAKWAAHAGVDLRIILRDENTELMDEFLTGGGRSIPKLVRLNENFEVLGTWGPRPTPLMEEYAKWKAKPEFDYKEWTLFAQDWYNKDKGASLEADFNALLG